MVAEVGDVEVSGEVHREAVRQIELSGRCRSAVAAETGEPVPAKVVTMPAGVDLADAVAVGIGDVEVAPAVQGDALDGAELRGGGRSAVAEVGAASDGFDAVEGARGIAGSERRTRRPPPGQRSLIEILVRRGSRNSQLSRKELWSLKCEISSLPRYWRCLGWPAAGQTKLSPRLATSRRKRLPRAVSPRRRHGRARRWMAANGFDLIEHPDLRPNHLLVAGPRVRLRGCRRRATM